MPPLGGLRSQTSLEGSSRNSFIKTGECVVSSTVRRRVSAMRCIGLDAPLSVGSTLRATGQSGATVTKVSW